MTDRALRLLHQDTRLAELAACPFDFDVERAGSGHVEPVRLASGGALRIVAGDAGGGTYFVCEDGSVLYADSEGSAGIVGACVDEALEIMIGLEDAEDYDDEDAAALEAARTELRAGLGFPERPREELEALLDAALARTEPDFLLLNAEEGRAYDLIGPPPPPLWEPVLAAGRADLAALRAGGGAVREAVAEDPVRRRIALRAAQFDRAEGDLGLVRELLRRETRSSMTDELRLAAVLVGLHGRTEDLPLLHEVRRTDFDTACGLSEIPGPDADPAELLRWARELDDLMFGTDPADEPLYTWTDLALDQGMTNLARCALIRRLDAIELDQGLLRRTDDPTRLDTSELSALVDDFERIGEPGQALRAQRLHTALQETAGDRVSARLTQTRLERETGQLLPADRTLAALRDTLAKPGDDDSLRFWRGTSLGRYIAEEHYHLALALADAGSGEEAHALLGAAEAIRGELSESAAWGVRELAERTVRRVRGLS
ncbi:hypothetical protein SAMN06272735_6570 [Streptomyces sp. TLI_55]|uniref:hypothetical protein n=1 Tax=Streptomyces sp. TLI_55 TaxID=1938861 RepID=UPI000BD3F6C4|nr:hypothetical protein [Streptomyces sp. TLI_55]SNX64742.1 hypothetical protein SAMN06272735_6570 [Streptomyces sp. TLI_55]